MTTMRLCAALAAVCYGVFACTRKKLPLFFKILLYGCISYLMGALFTACYTLVYQAPPRGFHVGVLGNIGAYFFLLSAYFGAIDRLADGGEAAYRGYRLAALLAPLLIAGIALSAVVQSGPAACLPLLLLAVPVGLTLYFACKHLILPDVEMGIIRVMRPYNFLVILFCLCETLTQVPQLLPNVQTAAGIGACLILVFLLPVAERGVRKWFM
ncbi:permease [Butyricicoccus faecihominis]|uniref:permease n=1 Tax=Butyricicoccus faecihominis TaxID=1712515 RepID=UPI00247B2ABA|nr:permease [Butyricicoccus faecihominis]MCQ5131008.1 permease [Butyricicoccus faecihominis]